MVRRSPADTHRATARPAHRAPVWGLALATALSGALMAGASPASAGSATSPSGTLSSPDSTLPARNTCGTYTWSYAMTPPPGLWALETFIVDPNGVVVSSDAILGDYTPGGNQSSGTYQLCRNTTVPGTFTLRGIFSVDDGTGRVTTSQMTPATFVLAKPTRAAKAKTPPTRVNKSKAGKTKAEKRADKRRAEKRKQRRDRRP